MADITLKLNVELMRRAINKLSSLEPELLQLFVKSVDVPASLFRINCDDSVATGTGEIGFVFQPSKLLLDFVATAGT